MGVFDKFLDIMKLNDDDDYEDDAFYDDDDFEEEEPKPARRNFFKKDKDVADDYDDDMEPERPVGRLPERLLRCAIRRQDREAAEQTWKSV